jgi:tetratricopeptide (TPR) repeat protein
MDTTRSLQSAKSYYKEGQLEKAEKIYKKILNKYPDNTEAVYHIGLIYCQLRRYDAAIKYLEKSLRFNPSETDAHINLGLAFQNKKQFEKAISHFNTALQLNPSSSLAFYNLGIVFQETGQTDKAAQCYQQAVRFDPLFVEAHFNLGIMLFSKNQFNESIIHFRKVLDINPELPSAYFIMGLALAKKGLHDEAVRHYKKALHLDPQMIPVFTQIGIALYNKMQTEEAAVYFSKALQHKSNMDEAYLYLGLISRENGKYDEAISYFRKALQANPDLAWAYTNLWVALQYTGEVDEAAIYLQKAMQYKTDIAAVYGNRGEAFKITGEHFQKGSAHDNTSKGSILIAVNTFNRKKITQISLEQTLRFKTPNCFLQVYNDHSTEYGNSFLSPFADEVIQLPVKIGNKDLRWHQFRRFLSTDFDFLYITDNDVIHDPHYISMLKSLYETGNRQLPVSLYNNIFTMQPGMILQHENGIFLKTTAPGCSMFFDRNMVRKIVSSLDNGDTSFDFLPWDNRVAAFLELPWIIPETSLLEHYGAGGNNNRNYERDRAINPTPYLQERRNAIMHYLSEDSKTGIDF